MKSANKKILSLLALTLTGNAAWASEQLVYGIDNFDLLIYTLGSVLVLLFFAIIIVALGLLFIVKESLKKAPKTAEDVAFEMEGETGWKGFLARINAAKPIALEKDIIMDHNYDGIQELDNDLPPWWKALFYGSYNFV